MFLWGLKEKKRKMTWEGLDPGTLERNFAISLTKCATDEIVFQEQKCWKVLAPANNLNCSPFKNEIVQKLWA